MPEKPNESPMQSVVVVGRRWFQRTYGNTYHTALIVVNGQTVAKTPKAYGYGDHYLQTAGDWLEQNGYMPGREHYPHGGAEPLWSYCRDRGIAYTAEPIDVTRERDL